MRVLFLVPYPPEGASYRYRIHQFLPYLKKENIDYKISSFISPGFYKIVYKKGYITKKIFYLAGAVLRRLIDFVNLPKYDILCVHLESSPFPVLLLERFARFLKKPLIYDLDDAIFMKKEGSVSLIRKIFKSDKKIARLTMMSSHAIVCNDYLKNYASAFLDPQNITIIPTSVDTDLYQKRERNPLEKPVIGWIGSHTTFPYLEEILDLFPRLSEKYNFVLKIVGAPKKIALLNVDIDQPEWRLENEITEFQSLDIGVYPLPDNEWVKGKTGFKPVQYMSAHAVCVASDIGRNREIIRNGYNGFLVNHKEEWIEKLSLLLSSAELRSRMAEAGRKTVEEYYSLKVQSPKFVTVFKNMKGKER